MFVSNITCTGEEGGYKVCHYNAVTYVLLVWHLLVSYKALHMLADNSDIITVTKIACGFVNIKSKAFSYIHHFTSPKITLPAALS